ncbi:hypothetical protein MPLA_680006 [Mesorhizobium sp. ORS 3359]|nr:hypothetical protein MPLA_680006 [Mesorhizobium sp. ORS 3359]
MNWTAADQVWRNREPRFPASEIALNESADFLGAKGSLLLSRAEVPGTVGCATCVDTAPAQAPDAVSKVCEYALKPRWRADLAWWSPAIAPARPAAAG